MEPAQVTVYSFEILDEDGLRHMPFKATREAVEFRHGGRIIDGTGEVVSQTVLDGEGSYQRLDAAAAPTNPVT